MRRCAGCLLALALAAACGRYGPPSRVPAEPRRPAATAEPAPQGGEAPTAPEDER